MKPTINILRLWHDAHVLVICSSVYLRVLCLPDVQMSNKRQPTLTSFLFKEVAVQ